MRVSDRMEPIMAPPGSLSWQADAYIADGFIRS